MLNISLPTLAMPLKFRCFIFISIYLSVVCGFFFFFGDFSFDLFDLDVHWQRILQWLGRLDQVLLLDNTPHVVLVDDTVCCLHTLVNFLPSFSIYI